MARKCTKKRDARAKLLFCQSKPIAFFAVLVDVAVVMEMNPHLNIFISNNRILICLFAVL